MKRNKDKLDSPQVKSRISLCMILLICTIISFILVCDLIKTYNENDKTYKIELVSENKTYPTSNNTNNNRANNTDSNRQQKNEKSEISNTLLETLTPELEVFDDNQKWKNQAEIQLFKTIYTGINDQMTVSSETRDNVVAPGTKNDYTFVLNNKGDVPVEYKVKIKAETKPENVNIPVKIKLKRFDNKWLLGNDDTYLEIDEVNNTIVDNYKIKGKSYTNYYFQWEWAYETEHDELDTLLGNRAIDEELEVKITIETYAEEYTGSTDLGGIPYTGDLSNFYMFIITILSTLFIGITWVFVLLIKEEKDEKRKKD